MHVHAARPTAGRTRSSWRMDGEHGQGATGGVALRFRSDAPRCVGGCPNMYPPLLNDSQFGAKKICVIRIYG